MDRPNMDAWVGRETKDYSCITEFQARKIHATVGEGDTPVTGTALPPLWHWCAFTPDENNAAVGRDGHIRGSELLPPIHLPRRMWAGGHLTFHRPLHVGENLERTTRLKSVSEKHGKSGPVILITLEHTISGAHGLAIEERQDIVHLKIPETFAPPPKSELPVTPFESIETPEILL